MAFVARRLGERNPDTAKHATWQTVLLCLFVSLTVGGLGLPDGRSASHPLLLRKSALTWPRHLRSDNKPDRLPTQGLAQRPGLRSAQIHLGPRAKPQHMPSLEPGDDLLHPVQVDDRRAVRPEKGRRIQP